MRSNEPTHTEAKTISIEEAARWLGVNRNTAYEAASRGEIPTLKIGRLLRVPVAPLERLLGIERTSGQEAA